MHWIFWTGIGLFVAGLISMAITLGGEGPPSFVEETFGYGLVWNIAGVSMIVIGIVKKLLNK